MPEPVQHPANVPGDFYVEQDCCTLCDVPFVIAPELFGTSRTAEGIAHCHVRRQPETPEEFARMVNVVGSAELTCNHYRGTDRLIQSHLIEKGRGDQCDQLAPDLREAMERPFRQRRPWWRWR